jgi:nucleoside-diphosphate-sugar epimerase
MRTLIIGATGYVGSAVARVFRARGWSVDGLARSAANRLSLQAAGISPVAGSFEDLPGLGRITSGYEVVVFAAMIPFEAEPAVIGALLDAPRHSPGHFVFTSGTGVLSIESLDGRWNEFTSAEADPFPFPDRYNRQMRIPTERRVCEASRDELHTTVIRPPLIYGNGGSIHVPQIFESVRRMGAACYLGRGLNLYSNVHVDDLAQIYALAVERGQPGALYHAVSGEANFRAIAEAVASVVGCGVRGLSYDEACELWGKFWVDLAMAVNSRSTCPRTRADLGWDPRHIDLIEDIRSGSYRTQYEHDVKSGLKAYHWKSHG